MPAACKPALRGEPPRLQPRSVQPSWPGASLVGSPGPRPSSACLLARQAGRRAQAGTGMPGRQAHASRHSGAGRPSGTQQQACPVCTHLQPRQRLLPLHHRLVAPRRRHVAVHKEAQHAQRGRVDAKVLHRLLQVGRALAACGGGGRARGVRAGVGAGPSSQAGSERRWLTQPQACRHQRLRANQSACPQAQGAHSGGAPASPTAGGTSHARLARRPCYQPPQRRPLWLRPHATAQGSTPTAGPAPTAGPHPAALRPGGQ